MQTIDLDKIYGEDEDENDESEDEDAHVGGNDPAQQAKTGPRKDNTIFLIQYHPRGTLDKFGKVLSKRKKALSNSTLWYLFDCCKLSLVSRFKLAVLIYGNAVFQMAVALRYPPQYWSDFDENNPQEVYERIPCNENSSPKWEGKRRTFVHFDIDLSNSNPSYPQ